MFARGQPERGASLLKHLQIRVSLSCQQQRLAMRAKSGDLSLPRSLSLSLLLSLPLPLSLSLSLSLPPRSADILMDKKHQDTNSSSPARPPPLPPRSLHNKGEEKTPQF